MQKIRCDVLLDEDSGQLHHLLEIISEFELFVNEELLDEVLKNFNAVEVVQHVKHCTSLSKTELLLHTLDMLAKDLEEGVIRPV